MRRLSRGFLFNPSNGVLIFHVSEVKNESAERIKNLQLSQAGIADLRISITRKMENHRKT